MLAGISWYKINDMQRMKYLITETEDAASQTALAKEVAILAVSNDDPSYFKQIKEHITNASSHAANVRKFAKANQLSMPLQPMKKKSASSLFQSIP